MRARILAAILLVVFVGLGVTGSLSYLVQRDQVSRDLDAELLRHVDAARVVVESDADEVASARDALTRILAVVPAPQNGSALGIIDGRPALVPGTRMAFSLENSVLVDRVVREVADGSARIGTALLDGVQIRYVGVPVLVDGASDDGVYLVAVDVARELEPTNRAFMIFVIVGGATLLAVALAGWLVAGRLLKPVRRLRETAERLTASDLQERIPVEGNDDISRLTETVNEMLDRLDAALRNQRELLDDVRHELRTPLTIIRGHLELVDPANPDEVRHTTELAIEELDRMAALVSGLATLAEVRAAVPVLRETEVDRLTRDVTALASAIPGHTWVATDVADGTFEVDRGLITQAWLQLADNAAKYAPTGTPIEVGSRIVDGFAELWVRDYGPGVRPGQETRIFERFARATDGSTPGTGLGLAIVEGIARAHGGAARVESPGEGARFVLSIPVGEAS
ncbi:MAG TPA: HAMP domain-containing sensor histidine kinase [Pseudolysinimonas sp.]|nr:HAMP domain-containing sensor histidine kinase [Pseudolysinimonas sp.]